MSDDVGDILKSNDFKRYLKEISGRTKAEFVPGIKPTETTKKTNEALDETYIKNEPYKQNVLDVLKSIERNTGNLAEVVTAIQNMHSSQQDIIIGLLKESLEIAKAKNIEEANTLYVLAINRISGATKDAETIQKAIGWTNAIYALAKAGL